MRWRSGSGPLGCRSYEVQNPKPFSRIVDARVGMQQRRAFVARDDMCRAVIVRAMDRVGWLVQRGRPYVECVGDTLQKAVRHRSV